MDQKNYFDFDEDMDSVLESTLEFALEAEGHVIDPKTRDCRLLELQEYMMFRLMKVHLQEHCLYSLQFRLHTA